MLPMLARFLFTVGAAFLMGRLVSKIKLPAILGWLITGMALGPHAFSVMDQSILDAGWYQTLVHLLECSVGPYNVKGLELTNAIIAQNSRYTHLTTGITDNTTADSKVSVNHKTISSETPMTVYQTDGTVVAHNVTSADMPAEGIFIVKNAGESMKVMVR